MTKPWFGNGTQPSIWYGDSRLIYDPTPPDAGLVVFTTSGGTFAPTIQLASGSTATVEWLDATGNLLASGLTPSITGETVIHMRCSNYDDIATVNLGFNSNDDAGRYNIGASYNKAATDVTGVSGLSYLPNLVRFMAASTQLTGHVDFSGLAHLEYIECFVSRVQSVDLTGCTSLIRLCLEQTWCSSLDLNPVRHTLRDLRAANQTHNGGSLTFVPLDGPMDVLYHYCIRDQTTVGQYSLGQLPLIEEYWAWGNGQSAMATGAVSPVIRSVPLHGNAYDQASVDRIISSIRSVATSGGQLDLSGSATPSSAVISDIAWLRAHGWTVTLSSEPVTPTLPEPVAAYAFDEGVGSTALDSSGNGHTLAVASTAWTAGGMTGNFVTSTNAIYSSQPVAGTIMCTARFASPPIDEALIGTASANYTDGAFQGADWQASGGKISWNIYDGGSSGNFVGGETSVNSTDTTDHHYAFTWSTNGVVVYCDGIVVDSRPSLTSLWPMTTVMLGGMPHPYAGGGPMRVLNGIVDNVRFFDVALTSDQVAEYMNTPVEGASAQPVLLGSWPLTDSLVDVSGNEHDAVALMPDDQPWTPTYVDGPLAGSRAVAFPASGYSIQYGRTGLEPTTQGFTSMVWARSDVAGSPFGAFTKSRAGNSTRSGISCGGGTNNGASNIFRVARWKDHLNYNDEPGVLPVGVWTHFALYDGDDGWAFYVNGELYSSEVNDRSSGGVAWEDYPWASGRIPDLNGGAAATYVSMPKLFHGKLTGSQIKNEMNRVDNTATLLDTPENSIMVLQESDAYTLGTEFNVVDNCELLAIRWWQGTGTPDLSTRTANVWKQDGGNWTPQLVAPVEIPGSSTANTWLYGNLSAPILLTPGVYRVGIFHPQGHFSATDSYFAGNALVTRGPLTLPYQGIATNNQQGNYSAEATIHAPDQPPYQSRNYWSDVVVRPL